VNKDILFPFDKPVDESGRAVKVTSNVLGWEICHVDDLVFILFWKRGGHPSDALHDSFDCVLLQSGLILRCRQITDVQVRYYFKQHVKRRFLLKFIL
jgi:hypothetical protein